MLSGGAPAAVLGALLLGCGGLTEIVVVVDSDLGLPADLDRVTVSIDGPGSFHDESEGAVARPADLPQTMGIEGGDRLGEPVLVTVRGARRDAVVMTQAARVRFSEGKSLRLDLGLCASCRGKEDCGEGQTCKGGSCAPVDVAELPAWDGEVVGRGCGDPDPCPAGTLPLDDGRCQPAGVPPDGCAQGFVAAPAGGCDAVLPEGACPAGTMALPGETTCREVAPCGDAPWGDAPIEPTTEFVDAAYAGSSDGSQAKPWRQIQEGIDHAAPGAVVAVAAGSYPEKVEILSPVRLWGRCPALVEVAGPDMAQAAITVFKAPGTEIRGLAMRGSDQGLFVAEGSVVAEGVWVHDTGFGIWIQGSAEASVRGSLVEGAVTYGIYVLGSTLSLADTVVRGTTSVAGQATLSCGICNWAGKTTGPSTMTVTRSVVENNQGAGITFVGSDGSVDASVVRDTIAGLAGEFGYGFGVYSVAGPGGHRSQAVLEGSVLEHNTLAGVIVKAADVTIEASAVRDTQLGDDGPGGGRPGGRGIDVGRALSGGTFGDPSDVTLRWVVFERSLEHGVFVTGSRLTAEGILVRDTGSVDGQALYARGIFAQPDSLEGGGHPSLSIAGSIVEGSHNAGVAVVDAPLTLDRSIVRATEKATDGKYGDGVSVHSLEALATATVTSSRIEDSARAGLAGFGADVTVSGTSLECNQFPIDAEPTDFGPPSVTDLGGNLCGCESAAESCEPISRSLEAPKLQ